MIDWFSQDEIARTRVCVVGAGAVGNEVVKNLVLLGTGEIEIIDQDLVELHNLTRSVLFRESDVGRPKAEVAATRAKDLDPNVAIDFRHGDLKQCLSPYRLKEFDCLIGCVDNFEARIYMNAIGRIAAVDFVNLGIDSRYALAECFPFGSNAAVACYECGLPPTAYTRMAQRYSCGYLRKRAYEERKIPTTIVTSSIAAALGTSIALRLGERNGGEIASSRILVDTIRGLSTVTQSLAIGPDCPGCNLPRDAVLIVGSRYQTSALELANGSLDEPLEGVSVVLSEPVVVSAICAKCGREPYDGKLRLRAARDLDEAARFCSSCGESSVDISYVEECTLTEFAHTFANTAIPVQYAILRSKVRPVCVSFED
jgi:molybdopterin/thiamine biosynthesis adenylyltransferase